MNRRDVLKFGSLALPTRQPEKSVSWNLKAAGKANPRGTARNCIIIEMGGAISHADCWDFKETRYTPKDLNVQKLTSDVSLSKTLFPHAAEYVDKIALVRSMRANEMIHFIGQYHAQTGRAFNVALAREIPALGSVVAYNSNPAVGNRTPFPPTSARLSPVPRTAASVAAFCRHA